MPAVTQATPNEFERPQMAAQDDNDFIVVSNTADKKSKASYINARNSQMEKIKLQRKQQEEDEN